jgi:hypothetical protein
MPVLRRHRADAGGDLLQQSEELGEAKLRQRPGAAKLEKVGH